MSDDRLLLFVCTGNVCRSPMAEYLLRHRLKNNSGWDIRSAGIAAPPGMPASLQAVEALQDLGISLRPHRSRLLTQEMIAAASLIVVMTAGHRNYVSSMASSAAHKVFLLRSFDPAAAEQDIADPIGMSVQTYREIRDEIDDALPGLISFMRVI